MSNNAATAGALPIKDAALKPRYFVFYSNVLRSRDWERFGCPYFESKGYEVVAVDCLDVVRPNHRAKLTGAKNVTDPRARAVNRKELLALLDDIRPRDLVMSVLTIVPTTAWIYRKFVELGIEYATLSLAPTPLRHLYLLRFGLGRLLRFAYTDTRLTVSDVKARIREWFDPSLTYFRLPAPKWWLRAGVGYFREQEPKLRWAKVLSTSSNDGAAVAHHPVSNEDVKELGIERPYAVYLDTLLSGHPDRQIYNWPIGVTVDKYFAAMNAFFSRIEQDLDLEVVIAAHPRSNYFPEPPFDGRRVFLDKTHLLAAGAQLVICDKSTSLSFPILYRRPVIFVITNELEADFAHRVDIHHFASRMGQVPVNVDRSDHPPLSMPVVEETLYKNYERDFLNAEKSVPEHEFEPLFRAHNTANIAK